MNILDNDITAELQTQVKQAISNQTPLYIHGGNSKLFYGNTVDATPLDISAHTGIINYDPSELCITVRAGTKLSDIETLLAENNQILAFEPPHYLSSSNNNQDTATIGGTIASGISGPSRAYTGSVRDSILGVNIINGSGEIANFGGEVMKNVAGYDLSRMMVRSQGTLGVILNISVRVIPKPEQNITMTFEATQSEALSYFQNLRKNTLPITATAWLDNIALIRLSASEQVLQSCKEKVKGDERLNADSFWQDIRDHTHEFFTDSKNNDKPLWRFSLPPATPAKIQLDGQQLIEWDGAQRWIYSNAPDNIIQGIASSFKGFATHFKDATSNNAGNKELARFSELDPALFVLHKQLKNKMDPLGIFNPKRIYRGL
ncbi:MAG: glycolate oxidase subunit GlcE [Cocleimonas sp.]|nr:glycolate oxidase subunit GlcE [Cocleimonas sp.]